MNGARSGLIYLGLAGSLGYLWVTGNLAKVVDYATRSLGGTPTSGAVLQPLHPITLPGYGHATGTYAPHASGASSHPGGARLPVGGTA